MSLRAATCTSVRRRIYIHDTHARVCRRQDYYFLRSSLPPLLATNASALVNAGFSMQAGNMSLANAHEKGKEPIKASNIMMWYQTDQMGNYKVLDSEDTLHAYTTSYLENLKKKLSRNARHILARN